MFIRDIRDEKNKRQRKGANARKARGRQYDSLRNSWPSPHCVVCTFISTLSSIASLSSSLSWKIAGFYRLYHLPRSNSSLQLLPPTAPLHLPQDLSFTFNFYTTLLIFHWPDNTNFNHLSSSRRLNFTIYFLYFSFTGRFNPDFTILCTTVEFIKGCITEIVYLSERSQVSFKSIVWRFNRLIVPHLRLNAFLDFHDIQFECSSLIRLSRQQGKCIMQRIFNMI